MRGKLRINARKRNAAWCNAFRNAQRAHPHSTDVKPKREAGGEPLTQINDPKEHRKDESTLRLGPKPKCAFCFFGTYSKQRN